MKLKIIDSPVNSPRQFRLHEGWEAECQTRRATFCFLLSLFRIALFYHTLIIITAGRCSLLSSTEKLYIVRERCVDRSTEQQDDPYNSGIFAIISIIYEFGTHHADAEIEIFKGSMRTVRRKLFR